MNRKHYKFICMIIVLLAFFSGLCTESVLEADHVMPASVKHAFGTLDEPGNGVKDVQICTIEVDGTRGTGEVNPLAEQYGQGKVIRTAQRISQDVLCVDIFYAETGNTLEYTESVFCDCRYLEESLTEFIHKSDGKKRICF